VATQLDGPKVHGTKSARSFLRRWPYFDAHGKEVIETVRAERPHEYLKIVASLVPKQMEIESTARPFAVIPQALESAEAWEKSVAVGAGLASGHTDPKVAAKNANL
jgi:hypothetical protein